jgi:hypothetical protein
MLVLPSLGEALCLASPDIGGKRRSAAYSAVQMPPWPLRPFECRAILRMP